MSYAYLFKYIIIGDTGNSFSATLSFFNPFGIDMIKTYICFVAKIEKQIDLNLFHIQLFLVELGVERSFVMLIFVY